MRFSDCDGHPVMSTSSAEQVGRLDALLIDCRMARVVGLSLSRTPGDGDTVHWEDVVGFGPDAVTVASVDAVTEPRGRAAELGDSTYAVLGKRILDDAGDEHGKVVDVEFDATSGEVLSLIGSDGALDGNRLRDCGSYAVIVRAQH